MSYVFKASPRRPGTGKSWALASPRLQPVWCPPQAPLRRLGGVSRRFDVVVRKLDAIPSFCARHGTRVDLAGVWRRGGVLRRRVWWRGTAD
jgi:hypothetical protein